MNETETQEVLTVPSGQTDSPQKTESQPKVLPKPPIPRLTLPLLAATATARSQVPPAGLDTHIYGV